jgi:hypothetical protein
MKTTVFPRIIAAIIWWISKDKQKGSERIVSKSKSEKSKSAKITRCPWLLFEKKQ